MKLIAVFLAGALAATQAQAQTGGEHDHSHAAPIQVEPVAQVVELHAGHAMPPAGEGAWSYRGRNNPKPHASGRIEVVPMGDQMQYVTANKLSAGERCTALLANKHMAVDRATRAACSGAKSTPPAAAADPHADHMH